MPKEEVKPLDVIVDLGNSLLKGVLYGNLKTAVSIPHSLKKISETKFNDTASRFKKGFGRGVSGADLSMFKVIRSDKTEYSIVGEMAESLGADTRRSGGVKYSPDYYTHLFLAVMLRLFPQGHENVRVLSGFPPSDVRFKDLIMDSLGGKHTVALPSGETVIYKVREVYTYDEPVGGLLNYLMAENGLNYRKDIPKGLGLCWDIGGKISTLVPYYADGRVDYANAESIDLGIQDVMKIVSDILLATYPDSFSSQRGSLPYDADMRDCLRNGVYMAGGYELSALDAIADATTNIRQRLKEVYEQKLGCSRPYKFMTVTGGGGGLFFAQFVDHVMNFNPALVHPSCDNLDNMHLSNLFGGCKAWASMKAKGDVS